MAQTDVINCRTCKRILPRGTDPCPYCGKWWPEKAPEWPAIVVGIIILLWVVAANG